MRYVYNAERERLASAAWNPHFFIATYEDMETKEKRATYLYAVTNLDRHTRTIAEKFMNEGETLADLRFIPHTQYEQWLCSGQSIKLDGVEVPAEHVVKFLIAKEKPVGAKEKETGDLKMGNLEKMRERLLTGDANLCQEVVESFRLASVENDIVREAEDVKSDPLYDAYNAEK